MSNNKLAEYAEYVLKGLVDEPDHLSVDVVEGKKTIILSVSLLSKDVGKIVGKFKRIQEALEQVFWAKTRGIKVTMEFIETDLDDDQT